MLTSIIREANDAASWKVRKLPLIVPFAITRRRHCSTHSCSSAMVSWLNWIFFESVNMLHKGVCLAYIFYNIGFGNAVEYNGC
jgi:hypothetical protein